MKRKYTIMAALILIFGNFPAIRAGDLSLAIKRDKIESLRRKAAASCKAGNYDGAILYYKEWHALDPGDPLVMKDLMWALWNKRYSAEAAEIARQIIAVRPRDRDAIDMLARLPVAENRAVIQSLCRKAGCEATEDKSPDAVTFYRQLRVLVPGNKSLAAHLLFGLWQLNEFQEGAQLAGHLTEILPRDTENWNWLGKMESCLGHEDAAIRAYRKSLEINPRQLNVHLLIGKELVNKRDFEHALEELKPLKAQNVEMAQLYPLLAKAQFWTKRFAESIPNWEGAIRLFPDKPGYQLYEAQALCYSGCTVDARAKFEALYEVKGQDGALAFMVDDALAQGNLMEGEKLLENALRSITPMNEGRVLRLATLYADNNQSTKLAALLNRLLEVWPDDVLALRMKAAQLVGAGQYADALQINEKISRINPGNIGAIAGMAECQMNLGNIAAALAMNRKLRATDPTNPFYLCKEVQLLYLAGDRARAKQMLVQWLEKNRDYPVIPVLLYHGLTPFPHDPILSYAYHHSVATFEDHIRTLSEAGYTPVVCSQMTDWYVNHVPLPPKPLMITFDDGRSDSFLYGDPILEKYRFRATMFAAIINIEGHRPPGYVSWEKMRAYRDTGRWEIQSHGDLAHIVIPANPDGRNGLFLITRQWLENERRYETIEEWRKRVADDYESSKRKITENVGETPCGYAFPQGYYGQDGNCNSPEAASINTAAAVKYFRTLYTQDACGINIGSRDPIFLNRFIPENHLTGKDLLKHLEENGPFNLVYMQLVDFAVNGRRYHDALYWLKQAGHDGIPRATVLAKESEIYFDSGDIMKSKMLAREALAMESSPKLEKIINYHNKPEWNVEYCFMNDSEHRHDWILNNTLSLGHTGSLQWSLRQKHGEYQQNNDMNINVIDNAAGAAVSAPLGLFHRFSAEVLGHLLSGTAQNTCSAYGALQSLWMDGLDIRLKAGRSPYDTAPALNAGVTNTFADVFIQWRGDGPWRAGARQVYGSLSDGNRRETLSFELSRSIAFYGALRGIYRFAYDDMRMVSPNYYSPQSLYMNGAGFEINILRQKRLDCYLACVPMCARDRGSTDEITHNVEAYVMVHSGEDISFKPSFTYYQTPSYYENRYTAELAVRF